MSICVFSTINRLEFSTDRALLLDPQNPVQESYIAFREELDGNTAMVILATGSSKLVQSTVCKTPEFRLGENLLRPPLLRYCVSLQ